MKIENLKELQKLVKLCRKLGIENIEVDGVKLQLAELPKPLRRQGKSQSIPIGDNVGSLTETDKIDIPQLTDEQLLFWSVAAQPDPASEQ